MEEERNIWDITEEYDDVYCPPERSPYKVQFEPTERLSRSTECYQQPSLLEPREWGSFEEPEQLYNPPRAPFTDDLMLFVPNACSSPAMTHKRYKFLPGWRDSRGWYPQWMINPYKEPTPKLPLQWLHTEDSPKERPPEDDDLCYVEPAYKKFPKKCRRLDDVIDEDLDEDESSFIRQLKRMPLGPRIDYGDKWIPPAERTPTLGARSRKFVRKRLNSLAGGLVSGVESFRRKYKRSKAATQTAKGQLSAIIQSDRPLREKFRDFKQLCGVAPADVSWAEEVFEGPREKDMLEHLEYFVPRGVSSPYEDCRTHPDVFCPGYSHPAEDSFHEVHRFTIPRPQLDGESLDEGWIPKKPTALYQHDRMTERANKLKAESRGIDLPFLPDEYNESLSPDVYTRFRDIDDYEC